MFIIKIFVYYLLNTHEDIIIDYLWWMEDGANLLHVFLFCGVISRVEFMKHLQLLMFAISDTVLFIALLYLEIILKR